MRDPHVTTLTYRLVPEENTTFKSTAILDESRDEYDLHLEADILTIALKDHHPAVVGARQFVEPFLRSWELSSALDHGHHEFRFAYDSVEVIDRDPPPPGSSQMIAEIGGIVQGQSSVTASLSVIRGQYSAPPKGFVVSPNVETLWNRYEGYRLGKEPLLSMAYFCLTCIEFAAGRSRPEAAHQYGISKKVLDTLGRLTGNHGDFSEARKYGPAYSSPSLTAEQRRWIDAAVRKIIRRIGEYDADPSRSRAQIDMGDLPELPRGS
jgi:hypothetical protein